MSWRPERRKVSISQKVSLFGNNWDKKREKTPLYLAQQRRCTFYCSDQKRRGWRMNGDTIWLSNYRLFTAHTYQTFPTKQIYIISSPFFLRLFKILQMNCCMHFFQGVLFLYKWMLNHGGSFNHGASSKCSYTCATKWPCTSLKKDNVKFMCKNFTINLPHTKEVVLK